MKQLFTLLLMLIGATGFSSHPSQQSSKQTLLSSYPLASPKVATTIRYVKAGSLGDGSSWSNASGDLQAMINASAPGDQIWLAAGTYKPTTIANLRDISFSLKEGVAVLGGFTGASGTEGNLSTRTTTPSSTTLSGDIGQIGDASDNSYHVIFNNNNGLTNATVLDGLVITKGNASGDYNTPSGHGGGICNIGSSPTIINCLFTQNACSNTGNTSFSGGGLYEERASSKVINCSFVDNFGPAGGGANVYLSTTSFANCYFTLNNGVVGGALAIRDSSKVTLTNCTFVSNNALIGAGIHNSSLDNKSNTVFLINCLFWHNNSGRNNIYTIRYNRTPDNTTTASYCLFEAGTTDYIDGGHNQILTSSPFANTTGTQLTTCSPAVDAGDPTTTAATVGTVDAAGNPRFVRNRIDIGAYEYQGDACPDDYVYTIQTGRWDDVATWSAGRLPTSTDRVVVKHIVTIPQNYLATVLKLSFEASSRVIYEAGGRLSVNPLQR